MHTIYIYIYIYIYMLHYIIKRSNKSYYLDYVSFKYLLKTIKLHNAHFACILYLLDYMMLQRLRCISWVARCRLISTSSMVDIWVKLNGKLHVTYQYNILNDFKLFGPWINILENHIFCDIWNIRLCKFPVIFYDSIRIMQSVHVSL